MRVTVVVSTFPSLTETFVANQVRDLDADVLCESPGGEPLTDWGPEQMIAAVGSPRRAQLRARLLLGLRHYSADWTASQRREASRYLATRGPDVVLAQFGPMAIRVQPLVAAAGIPYVAHLHGYDTSALARHRSYRRALRSALLSAYGVVVVNEEMKMFLLELGVNESSIHVIPCGVHIPHSIEERPGVNSETCTFVSIGRLVEKKGPLQTLRAFAEVNSRHPHSRLVFIGDGPLRSKLERQARQAGVADCVDILGALSHDDAMRKLGEASVFLQHSVTGPDGNREGWPISVAEAAARGLPVVATAHAGIAEQVVHGRTGFLVDEWDVAGMSWHMSALAENPALRTALGEAGHVHMRSVGDIRQSLDRLRAVLASSQHNRA